MLWRRQGQVPGIGFRVQARHVTGFRVVLGFMFAVRVYCARHVIRGQITQNDMASNCVG